MGIEINPILGIAIMMNNYFHDVATALLGASGVALWVIMKRYDEHPRQNERDVTEYFLALYKSMTKLARFSLYWILIGGVPRTLFYKDFEWVTAVQHGQVPALIVKHILAFTFVGIGVHLWIRLKHRVKDIEGNLSPKEG